MQINLDIELWTRHCLTCSPCFNASNQAIGSGEWDKETYYRTACIEGKKLHDLCPDVD